MLRTTAGQFLINDALPEELRDYNRVLDKKGMLELFRKVATDHPDEYVKVSKRLADIGREASTESGGNSIGLAHLQKSPVGQRYERELREKFHALLDDDKLSGPALHNAIIRTVGSVQEQMIKEVYEDALKSKNPLALQAVSGSRGNPVNVASMLASDLLYSDHHENVIPLPVLRSYSQGLRPVEYMAGTYGARKGVMATKFATQEAGFLSKQLNQIAHRLMVVDDDYEEGEQQRLNRGLPVDTDDMDNEGALLAQDVGGYKRNTALTPKILKDLSRRNLKRILVRSPMVGGSPEGGLYSRDVGIRETGLLPGRGEQIGLQSSQAVTEPIQQGQLGAKHTGGIANQEQAVSGFQAINQQVQIPQELKGGAAHADVDGVVQRIEPGPAGGLNVFIEGKPHFIGFDDNGKQYSVKVKRGDRVEAGDVLSEGIPHWGKISEHKGLGEGRRYFVNAFMDALRSANVKTSRRNAEVLARGLVNHVRLTDEVGDGVPDDVVPYSSIEHSYQPREGYITTDPQRAMGKYLERPVLHHTIGTKIRPSMLQDFKDFGVTDIDVHDDPPPFEPFPVRGMANLHHDPDWFVRMYGSGLKDSLLDAVHRGGTSNELGTSFVPGLSRAVDFGRQGLVRPPEPGKKPEEVQDMPSKPALQTLSLPTPQKRFGIGHFTPTMFKASTDLVEDAAAKLDAARRELGISKTSQVNALDPTGSSGPGGTSATQAGSMAGHLVGGGQQKKMGPRLPKFPQPAGAAPPPPSAAVNQPPPHQPAQTRSDGSVNYEDNARQRSGMSGMLQRNPQQMSQFISGSNTGDASQGFGGDVGAMFRLGTVLDSNALGSLTQGPQQQGGQGQQPTQSPTALAENFAKPVDPWSQVSETAPEQGQGPQYDEMPGEMPEEMSPELQYATQESAQPQPSFAQRSVDFGRQLPAMMSPIGLGMSTVENPYMMGGIMAGGAALRHGVPAAGRAIGGLQTVQNVAPRAANWLSHLGKAPKALPLTSMAPASRLTRLAGGKTIPALAGLLNVAWAPLEAGTRALHGDYEGAGKLFNDPEYDKTMADRNRGYFSRSWEAADPRNFYQNLRVSGRAMVNPGTTLGGGADMAFKPLGLDRETRQNKWVSSDAGQKQMVTDAYNKNQGQFQHNWNRAIADGRAMHGPDGGIQPTESWLANHKQKFPDHNQQQTEAHFLSNVFDWSPYHLHDTEHYYDRELAPEEMWANFNNRPQ